MDEGVVNAKLESLRRCGAAALASRRIAARRRMNWRRTLMLKTSSR
jgi:hypothetical protein